MSQPMVEDKRVPISEKDLLEQIRELARWCGWGVYHVYDSRRSAPGFPDLLLLRGCRLVVAELKSESGVLTEAQRAWLEAFRLVGAEVYTWRPRDLEPGCEGLGSEAG
jgi:hypothetical protein